MANGGRGHACVQAAKVAEVPTAGCRREERVIAQKPGATLVMGEFRDRGRRQEA